MIILTVARWIAAIALAFSAFWHVYWLQQNANMESERSERTLTVPLRDCVCHAGLSTTYAMLALLVAP